MTRTQKIVKFDVLADSPLKQAGMLERLTWGKELKEASGQQPERKVLSPIVLRESCQQPHG